MSELILYSATRVTTIVAQYDSGTFEHVLKEILYSETRVNMDAYDKKTFTAWDASIWTGVKRNFVRYATSKF